MIMVSTKQVQVPCHLREIMTAHGINKQTLCALGHISHNLISNIESHGYVPRARTRAKIAGVLGVDPREIWPTLYPNCSCVTRGCPVHDPTENSGAVEVGA